MPTTTVQLVVTLTIDNDRLTHAEDRAAIPTDMIKTALAPLLDTGAATKIHISAPH
jgi:hypothetical protein